MTTPFPVRLLSRLVGRHEAHSSKNDEMRARHDWLRCLDCGHVWDDLNPDHFVCDCFDRLGRRRSEQLSTITVQTHFANATDSTRPVRALPSSPVVPRGERHG